MPKNNFKRDVDLLFIEEEDKKQYVFIKDINTFPYDHRLPRGRKKFVAIVYRLLVQQKYQNSCYGYIQINAKQMTKIPKKAEYVRFNNCERKVNSTFMIYADFESNLVPEDNKKQKSDMRWRFDMKNIKNILLVVMVIN